MSDAASRVRALQEAASSYYRRGDFAEAARVIGEALKLAPQSPELWANRGAAFAAAKQLTEALPCLDRALQLNPDFVIAIANRAHALFSLLRFSDAIPEFERLLCKNPDHPYALGNLAFCKLQCGDWRSLDDLRANIDLALNTDKSAVSPDLAVALLDDPAAQLRAMQILTRDRFPPSPPIWRGERYRHDRIRIAYLSTDLHAHATATLMAGVFERHDRRRFETVAISFGIDDGSAMRARLKHGCDRFLDMNRETDIRIASLLRKEEIDIAVDLKGYTSEARPAIFALRPTPIQVNFLGFPATMGADFMDYIVADRFTIPSGHEAHFSEQVVRLPDTYQPNDKTRAENTPPPSRTAAGLPETGFIFCCFNNSFKIQPAIFDIWIRQLRDVDGSVLWLLGDNPQAVENFRREATARGVAGERLVFAPRAPQDEHLARHRLADLFLDTLPYNAHTTTSDALWMGLPVLTCVGHTFAGRVAASVLHAAGLPELVTQTLTDYEALALSLARDPGRLAEIKAKLARNRETCALFDVSRFTRHLEAAYHTMWERNQRGENPVGFDIRPD
jgi:predicted O-linked N-acetylglucosamine transferase (SPINDLY family)